MTNKDTEQPAAPKTRRQKLEEAEPWCDVQDWDKADANALQALERGEADPDQQRRALDWIITKACRTYDMTFFPGGLEGQRNSDLAQGRRFVGLQIVKLLKLALSRM